MISLKPESIALNKERWAPPQRHDDVLSFDEYTRLLELFVPSQNLPGRRFGPLNDTVPYLKSIDFFSRVLDPQYDWYVSGGNYFETNVPYRIHADTGRDENDKPYRTIVVPLLVQPQGSRSTLHILDQRWYHQAAFFLKGGDKYGYNKSEWNECVFDYKDVDGLRSENMESVYLRKEFPHINVTNFAGMSILKSIDWQVGSAITFDRSHLHVVSGFESEGVTLKVGLSLFLSYV